MKPIAQAQADLLHEMMIAESLRIGLHSVGLLQTFPKDAILSSPWFVIRIV